MKNITKLTFKKFIMTIGNLPSSYVDSLSYYECLVWLCNYLEKTVIPTVNNNGEAVEELQEKYVELKNYVDNYFDNLDVQEEINNKLDDMVEQGTLQEIITSYLQVNGVLTFTNVEEMVNSTNIIEGSTCKTLGYYENNDGGSSLYNIRAVTNEDIIDGGSLIALANNLLVAELINDSNEINVKQFGAKVDNESDDSSYLYNAVKYLCKNGGGKLKGINGTSFINNTIYLCNNIIYDFLDYTISGNGTNTLFQTGYYDSSDDTLKINYDPNYNYTSTDFPTHYLSQFQLVNATIKNCKTGIKGYRFNYRSKISNCYFYNDITDYALEAHFSWGLCFENNVIRRKVLLCDFADWNLIQNNSFEGSYENEPLLVIKGSYSAKVVSNGFHHSDIGLKLETTVKNLEISNNHFEDFKYSIYQGTNENDTIDNINIHNNWFHVGTHETPTAIKFYSLVNSEIKMNYFDETSSHSFEYFIDLHGLNVVGNIIKAKTSFNNQTSPNSKYNINNGCILEFINGRNDSQAHPQREYFTGSFTAEKYISKYNNRSGEIPMCVINFESSGTIAHVRTFVDWDSNYGVKQPVLFSIFSTPSSGKKYLICGIVMGKTVTLFTNQAQNSDYSVVTSNLTATASGYNDKLSIDINGDGYSLANITGIVKAL